MEALLQAGYVHRDVSPNNIVYIIDKDGKVIGYLIDWDLCKHISRLNKGALPDMRSVSVFANLIDYC